MVAVDTQPGRGSHACCFCETGVIRSGRFATDVEVKAFNKEVLPHREPPEAITRIKCSQL